MYFVGLGVSGGIATVFFISWKFWNRGSNKMKKKKGIV